jgi:hypothetical protein
MPIALGRFAQADTLVPNPGNPLAFDRYAYTLNNPLRYVDPSGHCVDSNGNVKANQAPYGDSGVCDYWEQIAPVTGEQFPTEYLPDEYWTSYEKVSNEDIDWMVPEKGTFSVGLSGTAGAALYFSGSMDIFAIDSHGNIALFTPSIGGGGLLPAACEGAVTIIWTDADNVEQLEGWSMVIGGSVELEGSVGAERVFFKDPETGQKFNGVIVTIGLGEASPIPAEGHVGVNHTWNFLPIFNLYRFFGLQPPKGAKINNFPH